MPPCHACSFGSIPRLGSNAPPTGFGSEMGKIDGVDAGRLLFRDTWNADLYGDLKGAWEEGKTTGSDVWIHKSESFFLSIRGVSTEVWVRGVDRMSAMWGKGTALELYLEKEGITVRTFLLSLSLSLFSALHLVLISIYIISDSLLHRRQCRPSEYFSRSFESSVFDAHFVLTVRNGYPRRFSFQGVRHDLPERCSRYDESRRSQDGN